jgi:hypothetical protein
VCCMAEHQVCLLRLQQQSSLLTHSPARGSCVAGAHQAESAGAGLTIGSWATSPARTFLRAAPWCTLRGCSRRLFTGCQSAPEATRWDRKAASRLMKLVQSMRQGLPRLRWDHGRNLSSSSRGGSGVPHRSLDLGVPRAPNLLMVVVVPVSGTSVPPVVSMPNICEPSPRSRFGGVLRYVTQACAPRLVGIQH